MDFIKLNMEKREAVGKAACGRLRRSGFIPVVLYGPDYKEALSLQIKTDEFMPILRGSYWNTMKFDVTLPGGANEMCMIKDLTKNFVNDEVLHIDFYQMVKGHKVTVRVPIEVIGKDVCAGVKAGGKFAQYANEVEISVLPREIPDSVVLDVSNLAVGTVISFNDLDLPESAEISKGFSGSVVEVAGAKAE
ncbi:MAG: 50S ribosomal protein L25 [Synergistales bacterium]|nr:50S ribosomal protein L25 [Synergistales bacterium]